MAAEVAQGGWVARTVQFYHEVMQEMRRVTWPDQGQIRQATIGIIIVVLVVREGLSCVVGWWWAFGVA